MSEMETHIGKMRRIECTSQEEKATELMASEGKERPSYCATNLEWLLSEYDEYVSTPTELWKVIEDNELDGDDDINNLTENEDGTISFVTRFYNGGACLTEMLEDGLKKLNK
jgi:hypothetical protein